MAMLLFVILCCSIDKCSVQRNIYTTGFIVFRIFVAFERTFLEEANVAKQLSVSSKKQLLRALYSPTRSIKLKALFSGLSICKSVCSKVMYTRSRSHLLKSSHPQNDPFICTKPLVFSTINVIHGTYREIRASSPLRRWRCNGTPFK